MKKNHTRPNEIKADIDPSLKQKFVEAAVKKCPAQSVLQLEEDYDFMKYMDALFAGDNGGLIPPREALERYEDIRKLHNEIEEESKPKKLPPAPESTPRF